MDRRRLIAAALIALSLTLAGVLAFGPSLLVTDEYDHATVTIINENGTVAATVDVRVADTYAKRYTGLSATESLSSGEGMLFVHETEGKYAYVMRDMDFPLDIIFVDANGTITRIYHAELPPPGTSNSELTRYRGVGKYVLEVPYGFTNRTGIDVGDTITISEDC